MKTYPTASPRTVGAGSQNPPSSLFDALVNQEPRDRDFRRLQQKPVRLKKPGSGFGKRIPSTPEFQAQQRYARSVVRFAAFALRRFPALTVAELLLDLINRNHQEWQPTISVPTGWSLENTCDPIHGTVYKAGTNACSLLQAWPQSSDMPGNFVNRMVFLRGYTGPGGFTFGKVTHVYTRTTPGDKARDRPSFVATFPRRSIVQTMVPVLQPINKPVGTPEPVPWKLIPDRPANDMPEGREEGNQEPQAQKAARKSWRGHARQPRLFPVGKYNNVIVKAPEDYKWEKPVSREYSKPTLPEKQKVITKTETKERKYQYNRIMGIIWQMIGKGTEVLDFEEVLFDALDSKERSIWLREFKKKHGHGPSPIDKARYIYRNWDKIDWEKAAAGFFKNQVEDMVFGKFGQGLAKASRKDNRPIGYQAGGAL